jgi:hypothetical protein
MLSGAVNGHSTASQPGYTTPGHAAEGPATGAPLGTGEPVSTRQAATGRDTNLDPHLVAAAARILAEARRDGHRLSQKALGDKLRRAGHRVANHSLHALVAAATGLLADGQADSGGSAPRPLSAPAAPHPGEGSHAAAAPSWPVLRQAAQIAAEPSRSQ